MRPYVYGVALAVGLTDPLAQGGGRYCSLKAVAP